MIIRLLAALWEVRATGRGQVLDVAIVDGLASLLGPQAAWRAAGAWEDRPGANLLQTAAPFYDVYPTADGEYVAVGAVEPKFYAELVAGLGLTADDLPGQYERGRWPETKRRFAAVFRTRTRQTWQEVFDHKDACVTPVLSPAEAAEDPHLATRAPVGGRPATPPLDAASQATKDREYTRFLLRQAGVDDARLDMLARRGIIG